MAQKKNVKSSKVPVSSLNKGTGAAGPKAGHTTVKYSMGKAKTKGC